jgi:diacylglycerol kinase
MMVCCALIAGLLALLLRPLARWRGNPLAWRPGAIAQPADSVGSARGRLQSFAYAIAGLRFILRHEPNMRIHIVVAILVVIAGAWFQIDPADWRWLSLAITVVFVTEAINTAIEQCCNAVSREFRPAIKAAKDVAAGAVLMCAAFAAVIGTSVFAPHLLSSGAVILQAAQVSVCGHQS